MKIKESIMLYEVTHEGRTYTMTGKVGGTRFDTGEVVNEYACRYDGMEARVWANADASHIYEE